jgi:hypothetical protein
MFTKKLLIKNFLQLVYFQLENPEYKEELDQKEAVDASLA